MLLLQNCFSPHLKQSLRPNVTKILCFLILLLGGGVDAPMSCGIRDKQINHYDAYETQTAPQYQLLHKRPLVGKNWHDAKKTSIMAQEDSYR